MSNRSAATPCDSMPLQTIPAPQRRGHLRGRARCWSVQTGWAASAAWRPLAVLAAAWGLAAAAPPNPAKVCAALYGGLRRRRAPRRSRAALPACPPQPPVRRLLPLASVPPTGADEPPRSHSACSRRGAAGECCGGAPASQGGRCYRTFQIPCAAQDSLPPGRTVAPRRKLRPAVRRRRTNPESGARFFENSCTRNRKSRPKRRLFSLLDNIGGIFRFSNT